MELSIIVPVYNVEPYLRRCIDSILSQTFVDFELILVDDGSPDECPAICDEYAKKDSRVKVVHKKNGGISDARNVGLDNAVGRYIGFVDSDDWIDKDMYETLMSMAVKHQADIVSIGIRNYDYQEKLIDMWPELTEDNVYSRTNFIDNLYPNIRRILTPSLCNKIFKSNTIKHLRFFPGIIHEDELVQIRYLDASDTIAVSCKHCYNYRSQRAGSHLNAKYSKKNYGLLDVVEEQLKYYTARKNNDQIQYIIAKYISIFLRNYFAVYLYHKELKDSFGVYKSRFLRLLPRALACRKACRMIKLVSILSFINISMAYSVCKKYFPECVYYSNGD